MCCCPRHNNSRDTILARGMQSGWGRKQGKCCTKLKMLYTMLRTYAKDDSRALQYSFTDLFSDTTRLYIKVARGNDELISFSRALTNSVRHAVVWSLVCEMITDDGCLKKHGDLLGEHGFKGRQVDSSDC